MKCAECGREITDPFCTIIWHQIKDDKGKPMKASFCDLPCVLDFLTRDSECDIESLISKNENR